VVLYWPQVKKRLRSKKDAPRLEPRPETASHARQEKRVVGGKEGYGVEEKIGQCSQKPCHSATSVERGR